MNKLNISRARGFTIIELMIVIIIIALLVTLAYPSYIDYVRKAKRGEAQQLLLNWAINQEIFRSNNPEYATVVQLPAPAHDDYTFALSDRSATTYTLTATGTGDQVNDTARDGVTTCTLILDENGVKLPAACWE
jgi:type IV pilus assembly protein PilE